MVVLNSTAGVMHAWWMHLRLCRIRCIISASRHICGSSQGEWKKSVICLAKENERKQMTFLLPTTLNFYRGFVDRRWICLRAFHDTRLADKHLCVSFLYLLCLHLSCGYRINLLVPWKVFPFACLPNTHYHTTSQKLVHGCGVSREHQATTKGNHSQPPTFIRWKLSAAPHALSSLQELDDTASRDRMKSLLLQPLSLSSFPFEKTNQRELKSKESIDENCVGVSGLLTRGLNQSYHKAPVIR